MNPSNDPQPQKELDELRDAWEQATPQGDARQADHPAPPTPPDLARWLTAEVRADAELVLSLVRLDQGERERLGLPCGWDHYRQVLGGIVPGSPTAQWLIEKELDLAKAEGDDPLSVVTQRLDPNYAQDIEQVHGRWQADAVPPTDIASTTRTAPPKENASPLKALSRPKKGELVDHEIGHYKLRKFLGSGGFGEVYAARHVRNDHQIVAVKLIRADRVNDKNLKRFEVEIESMKRLGHPNVARIYEGGITESGIPYLAMEFIQGVPFNDYCDNRRLSIRERLELFLQVCDGVDHIHANGLIHRDLSPDNILVTEEKTEDGQTKPVPKIIDMGVAGVADSGMSLVPSMSIDVGTMIGKLAYMSPEMAEGGRLPIDIRTDVFSLGVMLYEQIAGVQPLSEEKLKQLALDAAVGEIRKPRPAPSTVYASLDEQNTKMVRDARGIPSDKDLRRRLAGRLQHLPMTALELDRNNRFKSIALLATDIRNYLDDRDFVFAHKEPRIDRLLRHLRNYKLPYAAAATVLLALTLGIVGTTVGMQKARNAEEVAKQKQEEAEQATSEKDIALHEKEDALGEALSARQAEQTAKEQAQLQEEFARESERQARQAEREARASEEQATQSLNLFVRSYGSLTPMHLAAARNDVETIRRLASEGTPIDIPIESNPGVTPLFVAAQFSCSEATSLLMELGADPISAIAGALQSNDETAYTILEQLRLAGFDLAAPIENDNTALPPSGNPNGVRYDIISWASSANKGEIIDYLVRQMGIDVDTTYALLGNNDEVLGQATPLSIALRSRSFEAALRLLQLGANPEILSPNQLGVQQAIAANRSDVIEALFHAGLEPNEFYDFGDTLLALAIGAEHTDPADQSEQAVMISMLLEHVNPDLQDASTGNTALHDATRSGRDDLVQILLAAGASPEIANRAGQLPAYFAIDVNTNDKIIHLMVDHGLSIDSTIESTGRRMIHEACVYESAAPLLAWLIEQGADLGPGQAMKQPISIAAVSDNVLAMRVLLAHDSNQANTVTDSDTDWAAIHHAAYHGATRSLELLIKHGADVNKPGGGGDTPLMFAVYRGHLEESRILIAAGAHVNTRSLNEGGGDGKTALIDAAEQGHIELIQLLLGNFADVHLADDNGMTALHWAADKGHQDIAELLLAAGADPDAVSEISNNTTPAHAALFSGHSELARSLIAKMQDVNRTGWDGNTIMHIAAQEGDIATSELLLRHGASIDIENNTGALPIQHAAAYDQVEWLEWFLDIAPTQRDVRIGELSLTPLHIAAGNGAVGSVQTLLDRGADARVIDNLGQSPIHDAARYGHVEVVALLLDYGIDVNVLDHSDFPTPPIHHAAARGETKMLAYLLDNGASLDQRDSEGETPLHDALTFDRIHAVLYLIERGANIRAQDNSGETPLHKAAYNGSVRAVRLLLASGASAELTDSNEQTPLHAAAGSPYSHPEIIRMLIEAGADVHQPAYAGTTTPIHQAAGFSGRTDVIACLIHHGGDIDQTAADGSTPLHEAARKGQQDAIRWLIRNGASPVAEDDEGDTPIHEAAFSGQAKVVSLLHTEYGVALKTPNNAGIEPIHRAAEGGHVVLLAWFKQQGIPLNTPVDKAHSLDGFQPIHAAAMGGQIDTLTYLLANGILLDSTDQDGNQAVHHAAFHGQVECLEYLLSQGVSIEQTNDLGWRPLHVSSFSGEIEAVRFLLAEGANTRARTTARPRRMRPIDLAREAGHTGIIELLRQ